MRKIPHDRAYVVWSEALDSLEANIVRLTEWLACDDISEGMDAITLAASSWSVPDLPGQIPSALVPRAQSIAVRQGVVRQALADQMSSNRDHRRLARQVDAATTRPAAPAYLDLKA